MDTLPPPETVPEKPKHPPYLGWLAGYLVIYGGVLCILQLIAYNNLKQSGVAFDYHPLLLFTSIISLGVLGVAAGSGLWWGKKWGWWLTTFYFLYAFTRAVIDLVLPDPTGLESTRSWLSAGLGVLLSVVVLLYLYSHEILVHFHLEKFPRWLSLSILLVAAAILAVVF